MHGLRRSRTSSPGVLIDSSEAFLRAVYEFWEEHGLPPRQADLWSGHGITRSALSQRTARLVRDGLVELPDSIGIVLTEPGRAKARVVVRKHRVVELLLVRVIGLEWPAAHAEATYWQHILGDDAERKILRLLDVPHRSPYGCPIPAIGELLGAEPADDHKDRRPDDPPGTARNNPVDTDPDRVAITVGDAAASGIRHGRISHIVESVQNRKPVLEGLQACCCLPGELVTVDLDDGCVCLSTSCGEVRLSAVESRGVLVDPVRSGTGDTLRGTPFPIGRNVRGAERVGRRPVLAVDIG
ncbi:MULTISPECIES: metal-dependent transcriptional regulator [unclassified Pseudonocardia]|uniref:metal-dependent transcriptional regulator n=1 Tax=unclassified Pseudonocardia TaxID=2619320 RepID=UPI0007621929|nr:MULTISPECIES: metal-dependent transcriptional regulator [unclassified Pseudonocardia]